MKKKSRKAYPKNRIEFRFRKILLANKKYKRHPAYVFIEKGNIYIYVTITHSNNVEGKVVIKLKKNPNPADNADAYLVEEIHEDTRDKFGRRLVDWELDPKDDEKIRKLYKKR